MARRGRKRPARRGEFVQRQISTLPILQRIRGGSLAGLAALLTCTPLIPSESAAQFSTQVVVVMLWFLLLVAGTGFGLFTSERRFHWGAVDWAVLALLCLHSISAVLTARCGHARLVINTMWQWLALGGCYFLTRQWVRQPVVRRSWCTILIALATGLSAFGFYQFFVSGPVLRAQYEADPGAMLRQVGIDPDRDSPERDLFEDRLESTEPTATFALANSLAGFIAPCLVLAAGLAVIQWRRQDRQQRLLWGLIPCALAMAFCLLLTKSRTAMLATAVGLSLIGIRCLRGHRRVNWRLLALAGLAVGLLFAATVAAGAFDMLVLSEAPKSVRYRLEYWQASIQMIADHPLSGCGPGNFQSFYPLYKLPQASETIADPHNFLIEVWATAGTPALLAMIAMLGLWGWKLRTAWSNMPCDGDAAMSGARPPRVADSQTRIWVYLGGALGIVLAFPCGLISGFPPAPAAIVITLLVGGAVIYLLDPWVVHGQADCWSIVAGLLTLAVNLLAAGGIGFAGVAIVFWSLIAIGLNAASPQPDIAAMEKPAGPRVRSPSVVAFGLAVLLAAACYATMYRPVLQARAKMNEAAEHERDGQARRAIAAYEQAASEDPYSAEPLTALARRLQRFAIRDCDPKLLQQFDDAVRRMLQLQRHSHVAWRQVGDWRWELYRARCGEQQETEAIKAYEHAAELYPNSAFAHAQLAWCYHVAGNSAEAQKAANRALTLNALHEHKEKKLANRQVFEPSAAELDCENAEQLMLRLRRNQVQ